MRRVTLLVILCVTVLNLGFVLLPLHATPLPNRYSGEISVARYALGNADILFPLLSDTDYNFYRWLQNKASILGFYLFGGYSRGDHHTNLWVANPGFELFGRRWDAHLNGYLVGGQRHHTLGEARQPILLIAQHSVYYGLFDQHAVQYSGHGGDIELGYQLFSHVPLRGYAGSFFFFPSKTDSILGGVAGLEYWASSSVNVFARYSYDPIQRSVGALGIGVEFGGTHLHRADPCLEERMTDPVKRYIAELGQGAKIPHRNRYELTTQLTVLSDRFAFFSQNGTPNNGGESLTIENCTFEHPCGPNDFTQIGVNRLDAFLPGTIMYFNEGEYSARGTDPNQALILNNGQQIYGRLGQDYLRIPLDQARPTFNGSFEFTGNNVIDSAIILPGVTYPQGVITRDGAINSIINNTQIGAGEFSLPVGESETAVFLGRQSSLVVQNSQLITNRPTKLTATIFMSEGTQFLLKNSQVTLIGDNFSSGIKESMSTTLPSFAWIQDSALWVNIPTVSGNGYGVSVDSGSEITFTGGSIEVTATNGLIRTGLGTQTINNTTQCIRNNHIEPCL
jgi:hypothetical protein